MALYDEVIKTLQAIEDGDPPPTRTEALQIAQIKALLTIVEVIGQTSHRRLEAQGAHLQALANIRQAIEETHKPA